jgi:hypothetical protein
MEAQTLQPIKIEMDVASGTTLAQDLDRLDRDGLVKYADEHFSLKVAAEVDPQTIKETLLRVHASQRNNARDMNTRSLQMTLALDAARKVAHDKWAKDKRGKKPPFDYVPNPPVEVKFYFMQHPGANDEFSNTETYGFAGPVNKFGFKPGQAPRYNLFHGEMYVLPLLLVRHLESLVYVIHKPVIDQVTGLQNGTVAEIKPRFLFKFTHSDADLAELAEIKRRRAEQKGKEDEAQDI